MASSAVLRLLKTLDILHGGFQFAPCDKAPFPPHRVGASRWEPLVPPRSPGKGKPQIVSGAPLHPQQNRARLQHLRGILSLLVLGSMSAVPAPAREDAADLELVKRALAVELTSVQDTQHPMRYRLRKSSPRLTTTKEIFETKDGAVARLVAIDDQPLSSADEEKEETRLSALLADPGRQRHRKQSEDEDTGRVLKVMRALPNAFIYQYAGEMDSPHGKVEKFVFRPDPRFNPPDLETEALTAMRGELWIDAAQGRVARLEGHLQQDVDFGWGILGRLNKGGWIDLEQADVGSHQWRIVHFQMVMSGRVFFKTKSFDTVEDETQFVPVPLGSSYGQAVQTLRGVPAHADTATQ